MSQAGSIVKGGGGGGVTFPITVPQGGTGQTSFPAHTILLGEGTSNIGNAGPGALNSILFGQGAGADPIFGTLVAGANIIITPGAGTLTISATASAPNAITFTNDSATTATTNAGAINLFGTAAQGIVITGNGASTMRVTASQATTSQNGVVTLASNAQAIAGTDASNAVTSLALANKLGVQTMHGVLLGEGTTGAIGATSAGATNTVLLGNSGADPSFGTVPNAALTNSSVTLNSGNNITVTGGGPLALGGTASFNLTGTTANTVQIGNAGGSLTSLAAGTNGQVLLGSTSAAPIFGTITSPDNSILIGLGAGTLTLRGNTGLFGETITGDTGGPLSPTAGNWNIVGTALQGLSFAGAGSTLTGTIATATTGQKGVLLLASNAQAIAGTDTANAITADDLKAKLGVQTNNGIAFGQTSTSSIGWTAAGTTGQVLMANTGGAPTWGAVTPVTLTGNTGGPISPTAGNFNIVGDGSGASGLTFSGAGSTLTGTVQTATTSLLGVTQLATNAQTTTGASSTVVNTPLGLATKLGAQTLNGLAFGNGVTNPIGWTAAGTTGQVLQAVTGAAPTFNTLPAFYAYLSATVNNFAGNTNNLVQVPYNTIAFDLANNFNTGTHQFIAPYAGIYAFSACARMVNITVLMVQSDFRLYVGSNQLLATEGNIGAMRSTGAGSNNEFGMFGSWIVKMQAGDTAELDVRINGGAGATASVVGGQIGGSYFMGYLVVRQ